MSNKRKWAYSIHMENEVSYSHLTSILKSGFVPIIQNRIVVFLGKGNIVFDTKQEKLDFILFNFDLRHEKYS